MRKKGMEMAWTGVVDNVAKCPGQKTTVLPSSSATRPGFPSRQNFVFLRCWGNVCGRRCRFLLLFTLLYAPFYACTFRTHKTTYVCHFLHMAFCIVNYTTSWPWVFCRSSNIPDFSFFLETWKWSYICYTFFRNMNATLLFFSLFLELMYVHKRCCLYSRRASI